MWKAVSLLAANEIGGAVRRRAIAYSYFAAAALTGVLAGIYGLAALHAYLVTLYTPVQASLMIAGGLVLVAVILAAVGAAIGARRNTRSAAATAALIAAPLAARGISRVNVTTLAAAGMIAAGVWAGRQIVKS